MEVPADQASLRGNPHVVSFSKVLKIPVFGQASICFDFVVEDRQMTCTFEKVRGSAWQRVEGVLARRSTCYEFEVSGSKWNPIKDRGSPRTYKKLLLEASAEVLLEISMQAPT